MHNKNNMANWYADTLCGYNIYLFILYSHMVRLLSVK